MTGQVKLFAKLYGLFHHDNQSVIFFYSIVYCEVVKCDIITGRKIYKRLKTLLVSKEKKGISIINRAVSSSNTSI